jgi:hypothetical protein
MLIRKGRSNGECRQSTISEILGATIIDYDFIANVKRDIPKLLNETGLKEM